MNIDMHTNCRFGENCTISPLARLNNVICGNGVTINEGASLNNVVISDGAKVSRQVVLYSSNPDRPVRIGKDAWISHGVFGEGTGGEIAIGDYSVIAHFTVLLTSSGPGQKAFLMDQLFPLQVGNVHIGPHCWIGTQCTLLPSVVLPEGVVIGSNSLVKQADYIEWSVYGGSPTRFLKALSRDQAMSLWSKTQ